MYNVDRNNTDTFYRYKMPALTQKIEGKGNGIKTVVTNCSAIALALHRPPAYVAKHFGFEMGAQVNMDHGKDRYIVNGAHDAKCLQDKLDIFIKNWVLCVKCTNPETKLSVVSNKITSYCKACGEQSELNIAGRMSQYITKNSQALQKDDMYDGQHNHDPDVTNAKTSPSRKDDPAGWGEDAAFQNCTTDAKRVERYLADMTGNMSKLTVGADLVEQLSEDDRVEHFLKRVKVIRKNAGKEKFPLESGREIAQLASALDIYDNGKAVWAYCAGYHNWTQDEEDGGFEKKKMKLERLLKAFTTYKGHLAALCEDSQSGQKMMIGVVETIVHRFKKKLLDQTAHILKQLYDDDILDESTILGWVDKPTKKFVKKSFAISMAETENCVKFIEWLRTPASNSESDSGEESSAESDVEVNDDECHINGDLTEEKTTEESSSCDKMDGKKMVLKSAGDTTAKARVGVAAFDAFEEDDEDCDIDGI